MWAEQRCGQLDGGQHRVWRRRGVGDLRRLHVPGVRHHQQPLPGGHQHPGRDDDLGRAIARDAHSPDHQRRLHPCADGDGGQPSRLLHRHHHYERQSHRDPPVELRRRRDGQRRDDRPRLQRRRPLHGDAGGDRHLRLHGHEGAHRRGDRPPAGADHRQAGRRSGDGSAVHLHTDGDEHRPGGGDERRHHRQGAHGRQLPVGRRL